MTCFEATLLALLRVIALMAFRLGSHRVFIAYWLLELSTYSYNLSRTLILVVGVFILHLIIIILEIIN